MLWGVAKFLFWMCCKKLHIVIILYGRGFSPYLEFLVIFSCSLFNIISLLIGWFSGEKTVMFLIDDSFFSTSGIELWFGRIFSQYACWSCNEKFDGRIIVNVVLTRWICSWVRGGAWAMSPIGSTTEFAYGEMLLDLRRRSQLVHAWPGDWCTMEIWFVWVTICDMCMKEVLCDLQICFDESQWWCYVNRCYVDGCCVSDNGVKWHDGCKVRMFNLWLCARFGGFVSWVATLFWKRVYDVYARTLANICARCVVIIHEHWLALMQGAWKFLGWLNSKWKFWGWFDSKWKFLGLFDSKWKLFGLFKFKWKFSGRFDSKWYS